MILNIFYGIVILILFLLVFLLIKLIMYIPKFYNVYSYKIAEDAGRTYMDARLLIGIDGTTLSDVGADLDIYLNNLVGVDLDEDELYCIVESSIYRKKTRDREHKALVEALSSISPYKLEQELDNEERIEYDFNIEDGYNFSSIKNGGESKNGH